MIVQNTELTIILMNIHVMICVSRNLLVRSSRDGSQSDCNINQRYSLLCMGKFHDVLMLYIDCSCLGISDLRSTRKRWP